MNIAQAKALISVEEIVGRHIELQRRGVVLVGPCPFHDDQGRPNLVVFAKTQTWQCFACGAQGDVIDFLSRIEHISVGEAIAMVERGTIVISQAPKRLPVPREQMASPDTRNAVYQALIAHERLSLTHRKALTERGFSLSEIESHQYRTHTSGHAPDGIVPEGVPGFYRAGETWLVNGPSGLLIPVRDHEGRIVSCQIRPNNTSRGKYLWLSSTGKPGGTSSGASCHYAATGGHQLWITEGPLKADFVAARLGQPCLGVAGVANWRSALPLLGDAKEVVLAFDQDQPGSAREAVENNARAFAQALAERGVKVLWGTWDWTLAKGLDDALLAGVPITVT